MKLVFVAKTEKDWNRFSDLIDATNFYAEPESENNRFVFPDEDEQMVNELEKQISAEMDNFYYTTRASINGYFENE